MPRENVFSNSPGAEYAVALHPRYFGRNLRDNLVAKIIKDVEGTCSGRRGFVVAVTGIENVGKGLVCHGRRPFKGEILEAVVTMVNKLLKGIVNTSFVNEVLAEIKWLIPDDMEFQSGDMPNYTTSDGSVKIQKDCDGTRVDATEIFCIGTVKDDVLGVINDPAAI